MPAEPATPVLQTLVSPPLNEVVSLLIGATFNEVERELVLQTIVRCNGNRTHAARARDIRAYHPQQNPRVFGYGLSNAHRQARLSAEQLGADHGQRHPQRPAGASSKAETKAVGVQLTEGGPKPRLGLPGQQRLAEVHLG